MKRLFILAILCCFVSCKMETGESITYKKDYDQYLFTANKETYKNAVSQKEYWSKRLRPDSSGVGDLGPLAAAYTNLFETTGDGQYLKNAEQLYKKAITIAGNNKDVYQRGLARNYISQHRFAEAKTILVESYAGVSNKKATELMLFDVYMELGDYETAYTYLGKVKNNSDYNYLIRLSKWSDYKGNLDAAIRYMEQAKGIADSRDSKPLKIWTYSNLGDYYGHAGRIGEAYQHYLMTLKLQPDNAYAKKGIAWINYSFQEDTEEANRILDSVMVNHHVPDYYLLKSEMADYEGRTSESEKFLAQFIQAINEGKYGEMYNGYLIELYAESQPKEALKLAVKEVENRPTPETYDLLAFVQLKSGDKDAALETISKYVEDKTFEPMAQYHAALIYQAHGMNDKVKALKAELLDASFELGPVLSLHAKKL